MCYGFQCSTLHVQNSLALMKSHATSFMALDDFVNGIALQKLIFQGITATLPSVGVRY